MIDEFYRRNLIIETARQFTIRKYHRLLSHGWTACDTPQSLRVNLGTQHLLETNATNDW